MDLERAASDKLFTDEELRLAFRLGEEICDYIERCRPDVRLPGAIRAGVDHIVRERALPMLSKRPKELLTENSKGNG